MVSRVGQKVGLRFTEHGRSASVALRENHLVEEHDGRVVWRLRFSIMNEFIEACEESHRS